MPAASVAMLGGAGGLQRGDAALAEDACRIRCNPGVFAGLRHLALNLLRANGQTHIAQALYRNALCLDLVLNYAGVREQ